MATGSQSPNQNVYAGMSQRTQLNLTSKGLAILVSNGHDGLSARSHAHLGNVGDRAGANVDDLEGFY